jgi:beta-N-acetylhexosaminidase
MIDNTKLYSKYPLFIAVDEEGGKVSRIADAELADRVDSAKTIGETGDAGNAYQAGVTIGTYLAELGFNLNFAPVADLSNVENSIMEQRAYGSDAAAVSPFVTSMMQGLTEQGVTACLKHFPGIGSSTQDTHDGLASTDRSLEDFRANEFVVFQAGIDAGANMIMVGHMSAPALAGDNTPSSLSKAVVTDILRDEMNYKGVIISDALNMSAISEYYSSEQAAVMALKAGCDMILMPENFQEAYEGVIQAVADGTISEERINDSLRRIYRIKYANKISAE